MGCTKPDSGWPCRFERNPDQFYGDLGCQLQAQYCHPIAIIHRLLAFEFSDLKTLFVTKQTDPVATVRIWLANDYEVWGEHSHEPRERNPFPYALFQFRAVWNSMRLDFVRQFHCRDLARGRSNRDRLRRRCGQAGPIPVGSPISFRQQIGTLPAVAGNQRRE